MLGARAYYSVRVPVGGAACPCHWAGYIRVAPDLAVEILSPASRSLDTKTKRDDYDRTGVGEYWLIDPERETFTFYRNVNGKFASAESAGDHFESKIVAGFRLDLAKVRAVFQSNR